MNDSQKHAVPICEHIKDNNEPCGSPALRGFHFCYYHARSRSATRRKGKLKIKVGALRTRQSIETILAQVTQARSDNEITAAKATSLTRILRLAQEIVYDARAASVLSIAD